MSGLSERATAGRSTRLRHGQGLRTRPLWATCASLLLGPATAGSPLALDAASAACCSGAYTAGLNGMRDASSAFCRYWSFRRASAKRRATRRLREPGMHPAGASCILSVCPAGPRGCPSPRSGIRAGSPAGHPKFCPDGDGFRRPSRPRMSRVNEVAGFGLGKRDDRWVGAALWTSIGRCQDRASEGRMVLNGLADRHLPSQHRQHDPRLLLRCDHRRTPHRQPPRLRRRPCPTTNLPRSLKRDTVPYGFGEP